MDVLAQGNSKLLAEVLTVCFFLALNYCSVVVLTEAGLIYMAGYKSESISAAVSVSFTFQFLFAYSFNLGITSSMQTKVARYFGQANYSRMNLLLRQTIWIQSGASFCIYLPIVLASRKLTSFLTGDQEVAEYCYRYMLYSFPAVVLHFYGEVLKSYSMAQGVNKLFGYLNLVSISIFLSTLHFTSINIHTDVFGLALAYLGFAVFNLIFAFWVHRMQVKYNTRFASVHLPLSEGFREYFNFTAAYSMTEWIYYLQIEAISLIVGIGGNTKALTVSSTFFTIVDLFYLLDMGIAAYTKSQVNYYLGQKKYDKAQKIYVVLNKMFVTIGGALAVGFFFSRTYLADVFSPSDEIEVELAYCLYFVVPIVVSELMHGSVECILLSIGQEKFTVIYSLVCYLGGVYGLGAFLAYVVDQGMMGFIYSYSCCSFISYPALLWYSMKCDWTSVVEEEEEGEMLDDAKTRIILSDDGETTGVELFKSD
jgi:Na+-driven multidrug efflux pump